MCLFVTGNLMAQAQKSVTIFGDSYSTYEGYLTPDTNEAWYFNKPSENTDVVSVTQTWWYQLIEKKGWRLERNNSYSGSTVSSSGYQGEDYTPRSFVTRADNLGNPDIILVCAGTNDSWVPAPIGEYKYCDWTTDDLKAFRPSLACLFSRLGEYYPNAAIYFILNSELSDEIDSSVATICEHYNIPLIELQHIDKIAGHPSVEGMRKFAEQVGAVVD